MSSGSHAAAQSAAGDLSVPIAALEILEVPIDRGRAMAMSRAIRILHSTSPSDKQKAKLERFLLDMEVAEGQAVGVVNLPLPLGPDIWSKVVFNRPLSSRALFGAIIRDRQASLLYLGLQSMTAPTITYLANNPDLLKYFYRVAGPVGAFGGSFRVDVDGRVAIVGGPDAVELWEVLAGEKVTQPQRFAQALFGRNSGRLAYFFNAIALLDEPHRRFALGLSLKDRTVRRERLRALYRTFVDVDPHWSVRSQPFERPPHDPATLLALVAVDRQGNPAGPASRKLWALTFDSGDVTNADARTLTESQEDENVDAAWLAEQISAARPAQRSLRIAQLAFGQRVFGGASVAQLPDVLMALRGFVRYSAAMLALERIGTRDPGLYWQMTQRAASLQNIADPLQSVSVLSQFQGSCALLERLARTGAISQDTLDRLVASLLALPVIDGSYRGQLMEWVQVQLLPSLPPAVGTDVSPEVRILDAIAEKSIVGQPFLWEGEWYNLDNEVAVSKLQAVRAKQGGNSLDVVLDVFDRARASVPKSQTESRTFHELGGQPDSLLGDARKLVPPRPWPDASETATRFEKNSIELLDYLLGETLVALVYAPIVGDPAQLIVSSLDISHRHTFGVALAEHTAWLRPRLGSAAAGGQAVTGSLFGIDLALARRRLQRLSADRLPPPPRLNSTDRITYVDTLALLNTGTLTDATMDRIGVALERGRDRLKSSLTDLAALEALAEEVRMSEGRRQLIEWTAANEPEHLEQLFSVSEVFWLGARLPESGSWEDLPAWGMSHEPLSGCYCLGFPDPGLWDLLAGRETTRQLPSVVVDVNLRIAAVLSELNTPAALFPGVLALAIQDYVDTVPTLFPDDWQAISGYAWQLTRERIEDYISAAIDSGAVRSHAAVESPR